MRFYVVLSTKDLKRNISNFSTSRISDKRYILLKRRPKTPMLVQKAPQYLVEVRCDIRKPTLYN